MNHVKIENKVFFPIIVDKLREGHTVTITARGYSMMPFIEHERDKLVFSQPGDIQVGDVVLAEINPGLYVCHRIDVLSGERVVLRGDGNIRGTEQCHRENILGMLIAVERNGKMYDLRMSRTWKIYSAVWPRLLPWRRLLLSSYRLFWHGQLPKRITRIFGK